MKKTAQQALWEISNNPFPYLIKVAISGSPAGNAGGRFIQSPILDVRGNPYIVDRFSGKPAPTPKPPGRIGSLIQNAGRSQLAQKASWYGTRAQGGLMRGLPYMAASLPIMGTLAGIATRRPTAPPPASSGLLRLLSRHKGLALAGGAAGAAGMFLRGRNSARKEQQYYE